MKTIEIVFLLVCVLFPIFILKVYYYVQGHMPKKDVEEEGKSEGHRGQMRAAGAGHISLA